MALATIIFKIDLAVTAMIPILIVCALIALALRKADHQAG